MPAETFKINMIEEGVEKDLTRVDVVELLYNDVATVTFTKADGTERVMECTLLQEVLNERSPEPEINEDYKIPPPADMEAQRNSEPKKPNLDTIPVYDIEADDWRSFRLDSVKSIGFPNTIHTDSGTVLPTFRDGFNPGLEPLNPLLEEELRNAFPIPPQEKATLNNRCVRKM